MVINDERAVEAGKRALENEEGWTFAAKDPSKGHFYVSVIKSVVRMIGCVFLMASGIHPIVLAGIALFIAEGLGIVEEIV